MKTLVGKIIFVSVIAAQGVKSEKVERISSTSISKAIGENATLVWNIKGIQATMLDDLPINIIKGEQIPANVVLKFDVYEANSTPPATVGAQSAYRALASRSTAIYTYTGKSLDGQETASVSFTINNLTLDDEGSYFLTARTSSFPTNISVNYGPERCGSTLKSEYNTKSIDELMITSGFCGKPQPTVTCSLNGTLVNVVINEISLYNYIYTVLISNLKPCDIKKMNCTVTCYGKAYNESTTVIAPEEKVSSGVCAGHIVGFEIGVILIGVLVYVYLVVWKATKETGKLVRFIIAVVVGLALVIGLSVSYADLRKSNYNDNCGERSLGDCDKAFIAFVGIDIATFVIVVIIAVLKDSGSKTYQSNGSLVTMPFKSSNSPNGSENCEVNEGNRRSYRNSRNSIASERVNDGGNV